MKPAFESEHTCPTAATSTLPCMSNRAPRQPRQVQQEAAHALLAHHTKGVRELQPGSHAQAGSVEQGAPPAQHQSVDHVHAPQQDDAHSAKRSKKRAGEAAAVRCHQRLCTTAEWRSLCSLNKGWREQAGVGLRAMLMHNAG